MFVFLELSPVDSGPGLCRTLQPLACPGSQHFLNLSLQYEFLRLMLMDATAQAALSGPLRNSERGEWC